jgi:hypothetical protein
MKESTDDKENRKPNNERKTKNKSVKKISKGDESISQDQVESKPKTKQTRKKR